MRKLLYWGAVIFAPLMGLFGLIASLAWAISGADKDNTAGEKWAWAIPISLVSLVMLYGAYLAWRRDDKLAGWVLIPSAVVLGVLTFWAWITIPVALIIIGGGIVLLKGGPGRTPGDTVGKHGFVEPPTA
jgi:hypothetical protein